MRRVNCSSHSSVTSILRARRRLDWQSCSADSSTPRSVAGSSAMSSASSLCSIFDRLSRSSMIACSRSACLATICRNRSASTGSCIAPSSSVSTKPLIDVIGRFQLVRDVGHEVAANVLQPAKVGDVVEHDHGADGRGPRDRAGAEPWACITPFAIAVQQHVGFDRLLAGQAHG